MASDDAEEGGRNWTRRLRKVSEATDAFDEPAADDQLAFDTERWLELGKAGSRLAMAAAKGDLGGLATPTGALIRAMLDVEEAQARLLESIDENVKLLKDGPFKTGRLYLREAHRLVESPERSEQFVERAQEQFYAAHALASEPMDQAAVEMHIALAAILLGHPDDSRHWLVQAYEKAAFQANQLAEQTGNTKVIKGKGVTQAVTAYMTLGASAAYLAAKKVKRSRSNNKAQEGLRGVLPLVGCIASLHAASGVEAAQLPALELVKVKKDKYELVEVAP